jgi:hypothetical protein
MKSGRQHPGVVHHQQVTRFKQIREIAHDSVPDGIHRALIDQQTGRVADIQRMLGYRRIG